MSKYEGTKTEQNLMTAFSGESQARNKYTFYSSQARKAGYVQIANIFEETANQEKEHAKMWFKEFHGIGDVCLLYTSSFRTVLFRFSSKSR